MAGILFTDGKFTLSGVSKYAEMTGIGGKKEGDETPVETAVRETVEELFDPEEIPEGLFEDIINTIRFDNMVFKTDHTYSLFIMNFDDLNNFLILAKKHNLRSKVYDTIPSTLLQLILDRKILKSSELSHILLVPNLPLENELEFDGCFVNDIIHLKTMK